MCVSQFLVAILGTSKTGQDELGNIIVHNLAAQKAVISSICIYIFFSAASWGPIAWVVTREISPLKIGAKALSMTTATNWVLNWTIVYSTRYLFYFLYIVFMYFMIYETKGLTLEQVDELYAKVDDARKSHLWVPTITFTALQEGKAHDGGVHAEVEKGSTENHTEVA